MSFIEVTLRLLSGFKETCTIFALTLAFSLPLGLVISFGSMSKFSPLRLFTKVIVWIIRGIPLMLQIFVVFYVPGFLMGSPVASRFNSVIIAFVINYACYFSEIFRSGIQSISRGQFEAGQVLGMTNDQIFFKIILLQVIKRILPPITNEVITLVKDTALARVIMVVELLKVAEELMSTMAIIWPLFYTGVFYLLFVGVLTLISNFLEKKMNYFKV
ncbi:MAG: amino acid ABC transporter permease [Clostridiaceae bacterium]|nr:amino acid ABC transporter permease [Clostridiaceae bacterium]